MAQVVPIVVAGGGPAGAAAALVLAHRGRHVLLVEEDSGREFRVGEALPPACRPLLRDLGVLDRFLADAHLPSHGNVSAWGSDEPAVRDFIFDANGHGWHLDRARFDAMLRGAAAGAGVVVDAGRRVTAVQADAGGGWRVTLARSGEPSEYVRCVWLIDATGRRAFVARQTGATRTRDDALVAFFARFRPGNAGGDRDGRTMIEAEPDGWWYTALLPSGERIVAILTDADLLDGPAVLSCAGFLARFEASRHIRSLLAAHGYALIDTPRGVDAGGARLDRFTGPRWLAVGDAALSLDPLSSQGILTALYTGLRGAEAVDGALSGDERLLQAYTLRLEEIYSAYRKNHAAHYAAEGRWPERAFWRRRRTSPGHNPHP